MLDAFKSRAADNKREVLDERYELEQLIATARAERAAMDQTLLSLRARGASLKPIGASLDHMDEKVSQVTTKLHELGERLASLEGSTRELEQIGAHVEHLKAVAKEAEQSVQAALRPDGDLHKHRKTVAQLSAQARQAQASLDAVKTEHAALEDVRRQLHTAQTEITQSVQHAGALESELGHIRGMANTLAEDYARIAETSRTAREDTTTAMTAITEVEKKLGPLAQLQELGQDTDDRLVMLNALAERVSIKAKVIESQQVTVEHALVQANRVNEMVWSMEGQIGKLNEGMKHAASADDTLARLEKLSTDTTARLEGAAKLYNETEGQMASLERRGALLLESMHAQIGSLDIDKKGVEAVDERLRAVDAALGRAETRMSAFAGQEKILATTTQEVEGLSKRVRQLFAESDELTRRQLTLAGVHEQLAQFEDLAKKTSSQMDWLREAREGLEVLRKDVLAFHDSHAQITQLSGALAADRETLQAFGDRMTAISTSAPELDFKVNDLLTKMSLVEEALHKATWLKDSMSVLDGQASRLEARAAVVETIETRLNGLNTLSGEIDRRLEQQLKRRGDFEILKTTSDGVAAQIVDAQHKLEALDALQDQFLPLVGQVRALKSDIDSTESRLDAMKPDGAVIAEQERRIAELLATSRTLGTELAERTRSMQALAEQLERSDNRKDVLLSELDLVQSRQRDTVAHFPACEDQLARAEKVLKQIEERHVQIALGEKKLAAVEARLLDIRHVSDELDRSHEAIAIREQLVSAVKAEVEAVHLISARSKADLDHVMQHRGEVAALKVQVDRLTSRIADTDQRLVSIDARRKLLDEVENKANAIADLLDDVRINVKTVGEQKAIVDQVAQTAAQMEFKLQEARSILGTLQRERELAERRDQGNKQFGLKSARPEEANTSA